MSQPGSLEYTSAWRGPSVSGHEVHKFLPICSPYLFALSIFVFGRINWCLWELKTGPHISKQTKSAYSKNFPLALKPQEGGWLETFEKTRKEGPSTGKTRKEGPSTRF